MKAFHVGIALLAAGSLVLARLSDREDMEKTDAAGYLQQGEDRIISSPVYGFTKYSGAMFSDEDLNEAVDYIASGDRVEILKDRSRQIYYIRHGSRLGWVKANILDIPEDPPTLTDRLTVDEIEGYAADMRFKSDTEYFIWVDIARQMTYVLKYDENNVLRLEKTIVCATGKNESPTTRGYFTISDRGESFYNARLGSGARYWVRFNGSYLFHSIALNEDGSVKDDTLGVRRSDGCVRMSMEDSRWFYENIPYGTAVRVN